MMEEITSQIFKWIDSCVLYRQSNPEYDINQIDEQIEKLFLSMVAGDFPQADKKVNAFDLIRAQYLIDVSEIRQYCQQQKAGNIFCEPQHFSCSAGSLHKLASIDPFGVMSNSGPYAEIKWKSGFILESAGNLKFFLNSETS